MKAIFLKKLIIKNFRGIDYFEHDFKIATRIYGKNGKGKSSIKNAYLWLISGYDSDGRFNHELFNTKKKWDKDSPIVVSVKAIFTINGKDFTLERRAIQNWKKDRDTKTLVLSHAKYSYFIDGVKTATAAYNNFISNNIIDQSLIKQVTDIKYFLNLKEEEQRNILMSILGEIDTTPLLKDLDELKEQLDSWTIDEVKKRSLNKISQLKASRKSIPDIINDNIKQMPPMPDVDALFIKIRDLKGKVETIDKQFVNLNKAIQLKVNAKKIQMEGISQQRKKLLEDEIRYDNDNRTEVNALKSKLKAIDVKNNINRNENRENQSRLNTLKFNKTDKEKTIKYLENQREPFREKFIEINGRVFDSDKCPYCGNKLPQNLLEEKKQEFADAKERDLERVKREGRANKSRLLREQENLKDIEEEIKRLSVLEKPIQDTFELSKEIEKREQCLVAFKDTDEYIRRKKKIDELENNLYIESADDNAKLSRELLQNKKEYQSEIEVCQKEYNTKDDISRVKRHIAELNDELKSIELSITAQEKIINQIDIYNNRVSELMKNTIDLLFDTCKVQIVKINKSGDLESCCNVTLNGVVYSVCSNSEQIRMGVDVLNMFHNFYDISMPIFIDNAEALDSEITTDKQIIYLYVSQDDTLNIL